jgi:hypothetical protein
LLQKIVIDDVQLGGLGAEALIHMQLVKRKFIAINPELLYSARPLAVVSC